MEQAITILDWQRMLVGDQPPLYLVEIFVRTGIIYAYTLGLLRWLGSRTIGQLSTVEFLLVIALGSAVGDAMFYPDVPLLHALAVVTIVVVANKLLDMLIARFKTAERAIDGIPEEAISDGVLSRDFLRTTSLGPSEMFQQLREHGIEHLGQVANAYIEADGQVTVFRSTNKARPGLPIAPPWEVVHPPKVPAGAPIAPETTLACLRCGNLARPAADIAPERCPNCDGHEWTPARTQPVYEHAE